MRTRILILMVSTLVLTTVTSCKRTFSKEELLQTMSGVWSNEYNSSLELDFACDTPFIKNQWGNVVPCKILNVDVDNLTVIFQEQTEMNLKGTLRLKELEDGTFALAWKYDKGKYSLFSFVRKLDRFLEKQ